MAIFGPKPWVNPFGKMSVLGLFELLDFIARKACCRSRISLKTFFWPILPKKRKCKNWPFLDQKHRLIRLEKCQFFVFSNFLFLQPRKAFSLSRISQQTFSWPIMAEKRKCRKWPFLDQNHGLTTLEKCHFFVFFSRKTLFRSTIS